MASFWKKAVGALLDPGLPEHWRQYADNQGRTYYWNSCTLESTYDKPAPLPDGWHEHRDPATGVLYYYNYYTRETKPYVSRRSGAEPSSGQRPGPPPGSPSGPPPQVGDEGQTRARAASKETGNARGSLFAKMSPRFEAHKVQPTELGRCATIGVATPRGGREAEGAQVAPPRVFKVQLTADERKRHGVAVEEDQYGVVVVALMETDHAQLNLGDAIVKVNEEAMKDVAAINALLGSEGDEPLLLVVSRSSGSSTINGAAVSSQSYSWPVRGPSKSRITLGADMTGEL